MLEEEPEPTPTPTPKPTPDNPGEDPDHNGKDDTNSGANTGEKPGSETDKDADKQPGSIVTDDQNSGSGSGQIGGNLLSPSGGTQSNVHHPSKIENGNTSNIETKADTKKKEVVIANGMDQLEQVTVDKSMSNQEKLSSIEDVLHELLKSSDLSDNERMVILSTLDQLKKAQKLNLKAETITKEAGDKLTDKQASIDALYEIDGLLGDQKSSILQSQKQPVMVYASFAMLMVVGLGCFVTAGRTKKRYGRAGKGGGQDE